jgi:predicted GIY-YIG superfamily endonuclease
MGEMRVVYVLRSERDPRRHYVGLTSDIHSRLADHNAGRSVYTAKYRPWQLAVSIEFETPAQAANFERYLKSGSGRAFAKRHFERRESGVEPSNS